MEDTPEFDGVPTAELEQLALLPELELDELLEFETQRPVATWVLGGVVVLELAAVIWLLARLVAALS